MLTGLGFSCLKETLIGSGTGVAINDRGDLLTAAHVLNGSNKPLDEKSINDPDLYIVAKNGPGFYKKYKPIFSMLSISSSYLSKPISIDLVVLRTGVSKNLNPFLEINVNTPVIGQEVLMGGFSDEIELPYHVNQEKLKLPRGLSLPPVEEIISPLLIKSGMVGYVSKMNLTDKKLGFETEGEYIYIDNAMHSGSSGGPVIDENCQLIGIILQRAMTDLDYENTPGLRVPSGCTVAISPRIILPVMQSLSAQQSSPLIIPPHLSS
jgi:hypothetical protein